MIYGQPLIRIGVIWLDLKVRILSGPDGMCKIARTLQLAARCIKLADVVRVHGDGRGVQISELIQVASRQAAHDGSNKAGPSRERAALGANSEPAETRQQTM